MGLKPSIKALESIFCLGIDINVHVDVDIDMGLLGGSWGLAGRKTLPIVPPDWLL